MNRPPLLFIVESGTDVRLVEGLSEHFDVHLLARKIEGGAEVSHQPSTPYSLAVASPKRLSFAADVCRHLLRWKNKGAVLVQGYGLSALAANLSRQFTGIPVFMLVCSPAEAYYSCRKIQTSGPSFKELDSKLIRLLAGLNALMGGRYIVLSRYLESVVRSHGAHHVQRIPIYGVDTTLFSPRIDSKPTLKQRLGLPATGTLIFFSSRIAPEKDSETLLRAMHLLLSQGHNLWLLHRSGGHKQFVASAQQHGVAHRVIATDAVHPHRELPLDYQACDICVQASREEGLGFSPLEALACETPVVATAVGGLRETILDGETGWSYPVGDHEALADALLDVIGNPAEAISRARRGRQLVQQRFEKRHVFSRLVALLNSPSSQREPVWHAK